MTSQQNKIAPAITEQESVILNLVDPLHTGTRYWKSASGNVWACADKLDELFQLSGDKRIVFVSKQRADSGTYKVSMSHLADGRCILRTPVRAELCRSLACWLHVQISEGRPNIGVRILSP